MLPVPVPAAALGSGAEEAPTALVRHEKEGRKGGRPLCITHYLLGLILDDLDQLPGGKELFQGWDQRSGKGEGAEHPTESSTRLLGSTGKAGFEDKAPGSGSAEVPRR